jgi:soluble lytic murein transglycosylase-like protein
MDVGSISQATARIQEIAQVASGALSFSAALSHAESQLDGRAVSGSVSGAQVNAPSGGTAGPWADRLPEGGSQWAGAITEAAEKAGIDPRMLAALVWAESGFNASARSSAGAIGLTQLMPATAAGLGVNPHDPKQNLAGGARYIADQLRNFGRLDLALAAYNAGPGRVQSAGGIPDIPETKAYVARVTDYYRTLGGTP